VVVTFQLYAETYSVSDPYQAPNGNWQVVQSSPYPFQQIATPTQAEWNALFAQSPGILWSSSALTLADNSLIIADAEAVGPSRQSAVNAANNPNVGQSLFLKYSPTGVDPAAASIHWVQFVTTNTPLGGRQAGQPYVDTPSVTSPFYDDGAAADGTGFADVARRTVQNRLINWHADLFIVQSITAPNVDPVADVMWQGVSWGWQTVAVAAPAPKVKLGLAPNPAVFGNNVTLTATVTGPINGPICTGTVDFFDQTTGTDLGPASLQVVNGGDQATLVTSTLAAGNHSIVATYSGDQNFAGATSTKR
jgi:hypothetical protein